MKYFFIVGEASGDIHAAALIEALKQRDPEAEFRFLGGDLMAKAAGTEPIVHYRDMAFMGFVNVLKNLGHIKDNFRQARKALAEFKPDKLILVDYPSFNLKMAKYAKKLGIRVVYYISPKVWAWKEWRVKTIKRVVDQMLCIFPFEVEFYRRHGMEVDYVGNPSVEELERLLVQTKSRQQFLEAAQLPDKPIIAILPGSRKQEISRNLPVMSEAMRQFPQYRGVVAGAPGIDADYYKQFTQLPVVQGLTFDMLKHARAAMVVSGTATLEAALAGVPQVVLYRMGGKRWLRWLRNKLISVPYVSLPNLIAGKEIIPELLFDECNPEQVGAAVGRILAEGINRQAQLDGYACMRQALGDKNAPQCASALIIG